MANEKYISKINIGGENYDLKTKPSDWSETNINDPGSINHINSKYFEKNPLDLQRL